MSKVFTILGPIPIRDMAIEMNDMAQYDIIVLDKDSERAFMGAKGHHFTSNVFRKDKILSTPMRPAYRKVRHARAHTKEAF